MNINSDGMPIVEEDNVVVLNVEANDDPSYEQLRSKEREGVPVLPSSNYIVDTQKKNILTEEVRGTYINLMVYIAGRHSIQPIALFSAASCLDRYLSVCDYLGPRFYGSLVEASLLIAWNLYDGREDSLYAETICPNADSRESLLLIEGHMRRHLCHELRSPTAATFLRLFLRKIEGEIQLELLCYYIAELSLVDYTCLKFLASLVAASAVFLSRFTLKPEQHPWSSGLQQYSGYRAADLKECVLRMHDLQLGRSEYNTVLIKHQFKFQKVAELASLPQIPESFFQD